MKNLILTQYNSMQEKGYKFNKNYFLQFYLFFQKVQWIYDRKQHRDFTVWILVNFVEKYDTCDTNKQENKHFWGYLFYDNCLQNHSPELLLSFLNIIKMLEKIYYLCKKSDASDTSLVTLTEWVRIVASVHNHWKPKISTCLF